MTNSHWLLQVLAIGLACGSCAPFPMRHYYPEAQGGKVIYDQCPINGHLPDEILLTEYGVRIYTRLGGHNENRYLEIRFEIPEKGKTVTLVETSAKLLSNETDATTHIEFHQIYLWPFGSVLHSPDPTQIKTLDIHEPMMGKTKDQGGIDWPAAYWLASYLELPDSDTFQIVLPQFAANEKLITLPSIQFHRKWTVGFAVINC